MSSRGSKRWLEERAAWHARTPWPCAVLAVDPGDEAGAALVLPSPRGGIEILWAREVRTYSREIESCIGDAIIAAVDRSLRLMLVVEEWGRGGPLGIDTWIGLGEMRGAWRREYVLAAPASAGAIVPTTGVVRANVQTWRSFMIEETGEPGSDGKRQAFDTSGWKRAATRRCSELFPALRLEGANPALRLEGANAAEAVLIGAYAMRADEVGARLTQRSLREAGLERPERPRRKKRESVQVRRREIEILR